MAVHDSVPGGSNPEAPSSGQPSRNLEEHERKISIVGPIEDQDQPSRPITPKSPDIMAQRRLSTMSDGAHLAPSYRESRRSSMVSIMQIDQMISDDRMNMNTYGVSELREGFFDALFLKPSPLAPGEVEYVAKATLPEAFEKSHPLSLKAFLPRQWHELKSVGGRITTTRSGIRLLKAFLAFFIAYVLCLIPTVRQWIGPFDHIMVISVILNHPARTFGSQVDGTVFTIIGTASGLAWGTLGLLLSNSTVAARIGYGGILTMFLALFMASIAYIRSFFVRFYQAVACAGIAISFTILAESSGQLIKWPKLLDYVVPWLLGQAIALTVNIVVFPNGGNRPLTAAIDKSFRTILVRPHNNNHV